MKALHPLKDMPHAPEGGFVKKGTQMTQIFMMYTDRMQSLNLFY